MSMKVLNNIRKITVLNRTFNKILDEFKISVRHVVWLLVAVLEGTNMSIFLEKGRTRFHNI